MASNNNSVKVPMKWRMKAWWEGYDMDDVRSALASGNDVEEELQKLSPESDDTPKGDNPEALVWDDKRLETAQLIWGEGYCGPGGPEYVASMSKLLGMSPKMSVAVIGAGFIGLEMAENLTRRGF